MRAVTNKRLLASLKTKPILKSTKSQSAANIANRIAAEKIPEGNVKRGIKKGR